MSSRSELINNYPNPSTATERVALDQASFDAQKLKHVSRNAGGGAIGIIWLNDNSVVLARRTNLHPGWSLIGGTVEHGQSFEDAFIREAKEETGLHIHICRLVLLVQKLFISPSNQELEMDLAVFEANANAGQEIQLTPEAKSEGLEVKAFDINELPAEMIMKDREKLDIVIAGKNQ